MKSIKQWIEENDFGNVFVVVEFSRVDARSEPHEGLFYKDKFKTLLYKMMSCNSFLCSSVTDVILGRHDHTRYATIEEALLSLDKRGLFRNDLKWKMIMTIIRERSKKGRFKSPR